MNKPLSLLPLLVAVVLAAAPLAARAQDEMAGRQKAAMCIGCHGIPGYQASFPEVHKVPMISGQNPKYIASALEAYRKGDRRHPTMRGIAASLTDKDIADLSAFYAGHGKAVAAVPDKPAEAPSAQVAELLKKGNCASCHGDNMNKPLDPSYPKLAGQHADYLAVALKSYKTPHNTNVGRGNAIMGGMVQPFSLGEMKALSRYIASLPGELQTVPESRFR